MVRRSYRTTSIRAGNRSASLPGAGQTRRAFLSVELVLTLPILAIVLLALFEFCILFFARASLVEACRAGARKGTLLQVTTPMVEEEILRVLNPQLQTGLQTQFVPGVKSGDVVLVTVQIPMTTAAPDLLWPFGYSLQGRILYAETQMIKE
jgi:hypothetical protein